MSSDYNCFLMVSNSLPLLYLRIFSLTWWCKVQLEFRKTWGCKWRMEEKYLRTTLCHKLRKINLHRKTKQNQKTSDFINAPFKKSVLFLDFWKQLNVNQKQFLSNCSKQSLNTYICTHIHVHTYTYIFATQLILVLPWFTSPEFSWSPVPSFLSVPYVQVQ